MPNPTEDTSVSARVTVINEVHAVPSGSPWRLCLQWCRYNYDNGVSELGYRFIWRKPNGNLQAARGQARIPSKKMVDHLFRLAAEAGWADNDDGGKWENVG